MRNKGYKCYNYWCHGRVGDSPLCGEPGDTAISCRDRVVSAETNADRIRAMSNEELAIDALHAQVEAERNEPLTLEELREMDGEPVWVKSLRVWGLVNVDFNLVVTSAGDLDLSLYGGTGRLYRRKPEEGTK